METLQDILEALPDNQDASATMADLASAVLAKLPKGVTISGSTLLQRMGAKYAQLKPLYRWLYAARYDGLLDGFFTENTKRLAYGKPTLDWHAYRPAI